MRKSWKGGEDKDKGSKGARGGDSGRKEEGNIKRGGR